MQLGLRRRSQRIAKHRETEAAAAAKSEHRLVGSWPQIFSQYCLQIGELDSAAFQFLAIAVFAQIRLTAEDLRSLLYTLIEGEVLERMERVVVDKDVDRSLGRQQVRGMLDLVLQMSEL